MNVLIIKYRLEWW